MRRLTKYVLIGFTLSLAGTLSRCKEDKLEVVKEVVNSPPIVEVIQNIKTGEKFSIEYIRVGSKLRSTLNDFVEPYNDNCVICYNGSIPGSMITCMYDQGRRISVQFTNSMRVVSTIDDTVDSQSVREYRTRFEKDRALLKKAGLIQ